MATAARGLLAVAFAAALAGCGSVGAVGDAEWTLVASTPDGQTLLVETGFGGVASGCARFDGWEVVVNDDAVDVRARLWEAIAPSGCTAELVLERHVVELDAPLGDRALQGCGRDACRDDGPSPNGPPNLLAPAALVGEIVVVPTVLGVDAFSEDGMARWSAPMDPYRLVGGGDVVIGERAGTLTAVDAATGEVRWELDGHRLGRLVDGRLIVCSGGDSETMSAVEPGSGRVVWSVDAGCEPSAVTGDRIVIPTWDEAVDGGMRLRIVESATGKVVVDRVLDDGIDDQVQGIDGAVAVGELVLLAGDQSDLVGVDRNGDELLRRPGAPGWPLGAVGDVGVFVGRQGVTGVDAQGVQRWSVPAVDTGSIAIAGAHVYALDPVAGEICRFRADVGPVDPPAADWCAAVGRTNAWSVATDGDIVAVLTMLSVVVLDAETGALEWWTPVATAA